MMILLNATRHVHMCAPSEDLHDLEEEFLLMPEASERALEGRNLTGQLR
jgi:hypothetical protein